MAFSKITGSGLGSQVVDTAQIKDDAVVASKVDDDGTGFTVGNLTNSGTLQQTGQVTLGTGSGSGGSWTLPTARGANDKYVLQIDTAAGAATWVESLVAPEISSHNYDVSGSTDDGGINAYEAPYAYTGTTTNASTTISNLSSDTGVKVGQYISGPGIPANTTISSITNSTTIVISNQATAAGSGVALKIQKTPGEKNGGKVILSGTNFGTNVADISVAITNSAGGVIANASYITGLSGTSVTAEWTGTEGTYSTDLTSSYEGKIYFKITKSGLASNVYDSNTTLTSDATLTTLSTSSQTGGDRSATPSATSLGTYGSGKIAGGDDNSNTKLLLNFDRGGGTDIEDSSNINDIGASAVSSGHKVTATAGAIIKASPFGDGKSAMFFDGSNDKLSIPDSDDWHFGTGSFTIEMWLKIVDMSHVNFLFYTGTASNNNTEATVQGNGQVTFSSYDGSYNISANSPTGIIKVNTWYHLAFVRNSTGTATFKIFLDGVSQDVTIGNGTAGGDLHNMAVPLIIGECSYDAGNRNFDGYLDEYRIVKGSAVYTSDFDVPTSRLTAIDNTKLLVHSNRAGGILSANSGAGSSTPTTRSMVDEINIPATDLVANPSYFIDGNWTGNYTYFESGEAGESIIFDFKSATVVTGIQFYATGNTTYADGWTISGSNDSSSFSDGNLKTSFTLTPQMKVTWTNTTAYRYYRLKSSSTNTAFGSTNIRGVEFLNENTADNSGHQKYWASDKFIDSSDGASNQSTAHTITPTGSYHSQVHGGIAPALAWPASGKSTGSAGVYFDGTDDYLTIPGHAVDFYLPDAFTIDFWINFTTLPTSGNTGIYLDSNDAGTTYTGIVFAHNNGITTYSNGAWSINEGGVSGWTTGVWRHVAVITNGSTIQIYVDGTQKATGSVNSNPSSSRYNVAIGGFLNATQKGNFSGNYFNGYIDNFRIIHSDESASGKSLYHASANTITVPTKIYGAYGSATPDVGTITLTATGSGDYTWSEVTAGTALPGTLAVGSTAHSGSGNSRTHTATITGAFTSGVSSDTTTSGILLKAQNDADATKAITLGTAGGGYDGIGITQKSTGIPILFNGRRYEGNGASSRSITGFGFAPDFLWSKNRENGSDWHGLFDTLRGTGRQLATNSSNGDDTSADPTTIRSFDSDGYTCSSQARVNQDGKGIIAWGWKAGGVPSADGKKIVDGVESSLVDGTDYDASNGSGTARDSIREVRQSINTAGGFCITKFKLGLGNQSQNPKEPYNPTFNWIKHGLGGANDNPDFIILKRTDSGGIWAVWHSGLGAWSSANSGATLNTNNAATGANIGGWFRSNTSTGMPSGDGKIWFDSYSIYGTDEDDEYIMYAWKAMPGVSAFGTHTGQIDTNAYNTGVTNKVVGVNGYCGFKPRWLMIKCTSDAGSWFVVDGFRGQASSGQMHYFEAQGAGGDSNDTNLTAAFLDNGFTTGTHGSVGGSSKTYISIAFA